MSHVLLKRVLPVMAISIVIPIILYVWLLPMMAGGYATYLPLLFVAFAGLDTAASTFAFTEGSAQKRVTYACVRGVIAALVVLGAILLVTLNTRGS